VRSDIYSGGQPEGEAAFAELQKLGVKTILSVDGARPDVERAEKFGLRYVHIPVGYDGILKEQAWRIAKAVRDLPRPIYVHCHHGKHRGPAALAAALLCIDPDYNSQDATAWMTAAGTDPKYRGLIELPQRLTRPKPGELDQFPAEFPATAVIDDLTAMMVKVDERWDTLKAAKQGNWTDPDAAIVATLLAEHYRESTRLDRAKTKEATFTAMLAVAEAAAVELSAALRAKDLKRIDAAFDRNDKSCSNCHAKFRD